MIDRDNEKYCSCSSFGGVFMVRICIYIGGDGEVDYSAIKANDGGLECMIMWV